MFSKKQKESRQRVVDSFSPLKPVSQPLTEWRLFSENAFYQIFQVVRSTFVFVVFG